MNSDRAPEPKDLETDVTVIGGGTAGLAAAVAAAEKGSRVLVLEKRIEREEGKLFIRVVDFAGGLAFAPQNVFKIATLLDKLVIGAQEPLLAGNVVSDPQV